MVQPPSKQLQQILLGKKLCTPRDLKRCVRRVKRLAADLPAFDSVWLDALVQTRKLTSFQARTIESDLTELLTIGPGIVLDQIGAGPAAATYLVRIPEAQIPAVIKRVPVATELKAGTLTRFRELSQRAAAVGHAAVVVPHACHEIARVVELPRPVAKTEKGVSPSRRRRKAEPANDLMGELAVASRLVEGLTLSQMILRRGRFPAAVVQEIARQLLESLAALDAAGIVHGEILTGNVLIDSRARAILVDAGVRPCVQPAFSFSATIDPQRYSGIAPELIGTGQPWSHRSDLYALGCLLWELLTARPVFPTGDPLARLAAHQTTRVPDVREIAPDTPDSLAEAILWLTEPDLEQRPRSATEVLGRAAGSSRRSPAKSEQVRVTGAGAMSGSAGSLASAPGGHRDTSRRVTLARSSHRSLAGFSAGFSRRPSRRASQSNGNVRFAGHIAVAGLAVIVAAASLFTLHGQPREWVTAAIAASTGSGGNTDAKNAADAGLNSIAQVGNASDRQLSTDARQFSQPDAYGLLELSGAGPWQAESLLWSGQRLTIRGTDATPSIVVIDRPVRFRASEIVVENVEFVFRTPQLSLPPNAEVSASDGSGGASRQPVAGETNQPVVPSLQFASQALSVSDGAFLSEEDDSGSASPTQPGSAADRQQSSTQTPFAFFWTPSNPRDSLPGEISIQNTRLIGRRSSIGLRGGRHLVDCRNVLQSGPESLFVIAQGKVPGRHDFELEHCTLRESGGLVEVLLDDGGVWRSQVHIQPDECVFDFPASGMGEPGALVRFRFGADRLAPTWPETLIIDGKDSIARPDLKLVEGVSRDGRLRKVLDASNVTLNGLIGASFEFQSATVRPDFAASMLKQHDASLEATARPGIGRDETSRNSAAKEPVQVPVPEAETFYESEAKR